MLLIHEAPIIHVYFWFPLLVLCVLMSEFNQFHKMTGKMPLGTEQVGSNKCGRILPVAFFQIPLALSKIVVQFSTFRTNGPWRHQMNLNFLKIGMMYVFDMVE